MEKITYHIPLIVWGEPYIATYLNLSLPSQMTPGNLEFLSQQAEVYYYLFTPKKEFTDLSDAPVFQKLQKLVKLKWIELKDCDFLQKNRVVDRCQEQIIKEVGTKGPMLFHYPDLIYSENSFRTLHQLVLEGKRLIVSSGVQIWLEKFVELARQQNLTFPKSSRALVQLGLQCVNDIVASNLWETEQMNIWPSVAYWKLGDEGLLIRGFHLHPYLVWPEKRDRKNFKGIEFRFLGRVCPRPATWKVIVDSDAFLCLSLSTMEVNNVTAMVERSLKYLAQWMYRYTTPIHRYFVKQRIFLHTKGIQESWNPIVERSDRIIESILLRYRKPPLTDRVDRMKFFLFQLKSKILFQLSNISWKKALPASLSKTQCEP